MLAPAVNVGHVFTAHAQKQLFMNFRSLIWPRHSFWRPRFPIRHMYFHYRVTFARYIWRFCATASHHHVTMTFDVLTLSVYDELNFIHPTHLLIFSTLRLSLSELWVTQSDHITIIWNAHCACAVSRDLSPWGKNDQHFWNPWRHFTYSLCHSQGAKTKIKQCYWRYPIVKVTKFTAHAQYHVTCA